MTHVLMVKRFSWSLGLSPGLGLDLAHCTDYPAHELRPLGSFNFNPF